MQQFTIRRNNYLSRDTSAFHYADYYGGIGRHKDAGTIEHAIVTLKNDPKRPEKELQEAVRSIRDILLDDVPKVIEQAGLSYPTICVVPRAKAYIDPEMLWFLTTVDFVTCQLFDTAQNGTDYIKRAKNTRTTHLDKWGKGGDGDMPYSGITKDTCRISSEVLGKDILLIDDLYTATVNIDEDAIQALYDNGANSIIFYAIGKTVRQS